VDFRKRKKIWCFDGHQPFLMSKIYHNFDIKRNSCRIERQNYRLMSKIYTNFNIMAYNKNIPFNDLPALPPQGFTETPEILRQLARAARHLGELNGLCASLPEPQILINTIVLQESKYSSAIENIVTTQDELYRAATENATESLTAKEVLSYREALYVGLEK